MAYYVSYYSVLSSVYEAYSRCENGAVLFGFVGCMHSVLLNSIVSIQVFSVVAKCTS
jgi:hypothetical protein